MSKSVVIVAYYYPIASPLFKSLIPLSILIVSLCINTSQCSHSTSVMVNETNSDCTEGKKNRVWFTLLFRISELTMINSKLSNYRNVMHSDLLDTIIIVLTLLQQSVQINNNKFEKLY